MAESGERKVDPRLTGSPLLKSPSKRGKRVNASSNYLATADQNQSVKDRRLTPVPARPSEPTNSTVTPQRGIGSAGTNNNAEIADRSKTARTYGMVRAAVSMPADLKNTFDAWAQAMRQQKSAARRRGSRRLSSERITTSTIIRAAMETIIQRFDVDDFGLIEDENELRLYFMDELARRTRND